MEQKNIFYTDDLHGVILKCVYSSNVNNLTKNFRQIYSSNQM